MSPSNERLQLSGAFALRKKDCIPAALRRTFSIPLLACSSPVAEALIG